MPNMHTTPRTPHKIVTGSKLNFLTDLLCPFGVPFLIVKTQPSIGDAPDTKVGVFTLLPNENRPVDRRRSADNIDCDDVTILM